MFISQYRKVRNHCCVRICLCCPVVFFGNQRRERGRQTETSERHRGTETERITHLVQSLPNRQFIRTCTHAHTHNTHTHTHAQYNALHVTGSEFKVLRSVHVCELLSHWSRSPAANLIFCAFQAQLCAQTKQWRTR